MIERTLAKLIKALEDLKLLKRYCVSQCIMLLCSYVSVTFMLEAMAAANALLRLKRKVCLV